ncbi:MAG: hypothetical protein DRH17_11725 [Deltaproteobacteria bacterium]|nr:MAG: hypothetical protein DRH17_11725 [Deltaproteobacteria bacterium]
MKGYKKGYMLNFFVLYIPPHPCLAKKAKNSYTIKKQVNTKRPRRLKESYTLLKSHGLFQF